MDASDTFMGVDRAQVGVTLTAIEEAIHRLNAADQLEEIFLKIAEARGGLEVGEMLLRDILSHAPGLVLAPPPGRTRNQEVRVVDRAQLESTLTAIKEAISRLNAASQLEDVFVEVKEAGSGLGEAARLLRDILSPAP